VIAPVDERDLEIHHREAGNDAGAQHRFEALLDAGNELLRHRTADNLVFEHEAGAGRQRLGTILTWANWPVPPVCFLCW